MRFELQTWARVFVPTDSLTRRVKQQWNDLTGHKSPRERAAAFSTFGRATGWRSWVTGLRDSAGIDSLGLEIFGPLRFETGKTDGWLARSPEGPSLAGAPRGASIVRGTFGRCPLARCHGPGKGRGEVIILTRRAPNRGQILPRGQLRVGPPARRRRHPGGDIRGRPPPRARDEQTGHRGRRRRGVHQRPRRPRRPRRGPPQRAEAPFGPGDRVHARGVLPRRADRPSELERGRAHHAELAQDARAAAARGRRPPPGAGGRRAHLRAPRQNIQKVLQ